MIPVPQSDSSTSLPSSREFNDTEYINRPRVQRQSKVDREVAGIKCRSRCSIVVTSVISVRLNDKLGHEEEGRQENDLLNLIYLVMILSVSNEDPLRQPTCRS